jgi:pilus assembly protein CpaE
MGEGDKIRVLIVDDNPETRENIRKLLQFESNVEVCGAARTGLEGIELATETQPHVVLMDINMPDMDGIAATEAIKRKLPYTQIVILSVQYDPKYMQKAMLVGARNFLAKPPAIDELISTIQTVGKMGLEEQARVTLNQQLQASGPGKGSMMLTHGKVITVYSPKGGTGTTTMAVNLAMALMSQESKVLVVDANLQYGDVAVFNNEQARNSIVDLTPRATELDPDIIKEVVISHKSGLNILAAPPRPEMAENIRAGEFKQVIDYMRSLYSFIVIDTESHLTETVLDAIEVSDALLLVTTQEIPSIKNTKTFLTLVDQFQIGRQRVIFIVNKYDKRIALLPEKIGESLKLEVAAVIPFEERIVLNSINTGVPFMIDNKAQPIGKSMLAMAEVIKEKLKKLENADIERAVGRF